MGGVFGGIGKVFKSAARIAAPIVGGLLGGPGGAAAGGALSGLMAGGNRHDIFRNVGLGAATSGLGASTGQSVGSWLGKALGGTSLYSQALGSTATLGTIGSSIGSFLGNQQGQGMSNAYEQMYQLRKYGTASQPSSLPLTTPSFAELKAQAEAKTQEIFENEGLPRVFTYDSPFRRMMSENRVDIYNRSRFPSLKQVKQALKKKYV